MNAGASFIVDLLTELSAECSDVMSVSFSALDATFFRQTFILIDLPKSCGQTRSVSVLVCHDHTVTFEGLTEALATYHSQRLQLKITDG